MSFNSSAATSSHGAAPPMYWCHECAIEMRPLMTPGPTCPRCNGEFVEEVDPSNPIPEEEAEENDDVEMSGPERLFAGAARDRTANPSGDQGMDLGSLVGGILRGLATAGSQPRPAAQPSGSTTTPLQGDSTSSSNFRTGTSQVDPLNVSWGIHQTRIRNQQGGTTTSNSTNTQGFNPESFSRIQALGLTDYLRQSFDTEDYRHDDGMGGAGGAADGRFFNMDNRTNRPETSQQNENNNDDQDSNGYSPELASIRDVFANLFGGMGDGPASMLIDLFGGGTGRGRTGDYVWGQQGLDDVITQLMDQTRGSTAPPPASDEAINQLDRFSRKDVARVRQARNRECATCMDSFEEEEESPEPSMDSNRLSSTLKTPSGQEDDDPPEVIPLEEQQDELMMMPCKHLFHLDCLKPWLKTNGTCPVCRVGLDKQATKTNESAAPTLEYRNEQQNHSSSSASTLNPVSDDEDESTDAIRERSRRAAEARMTGTFTQTRDPPALETDELD